MKKSLLGLMLVLFCIGLFAAAGCGSSDKKSSSGGSAPVGAPANKDEAIKRCLDEAKKLPDADSRKTATAACNAASSGNTNAVKDAARQQCLNAAKGIPDAAARKQAEDACRKSTQ
jgi:hypothetical protein